MSTRQKDSYTIQSVENALELLEALCAGKQNIRISELSERVGMNKTSVFRLLATFENRGYVIKDERTGKYRLGPAAFETGQKMLAGMELLRIAKPAMEKLARSCDEAVYLGVQRDAEVLLIDMVDTTQQVKIIPLLGQRFSLCGPAAGRVLLANDPALQQLCHIEEIIQIENELTAIQQAGYCYDKGPLGEGSASLAVPLFDEEKQIGGSLCLVGPEFRFDDARIKTELLPKLLETGVIISSKLGYVGHFLNRT